MGYLHKLNDMNAELLYLNLQTHLHFHDYLLVCITLPIFLVSFKC